MNEIHQVPGLMSIFGLGFAAVFAVFTLLYRYAYSKRRELGLNEYEEVRTRHDMIASAVTCGVGLLVAVAAQLLPVSVSFFSVFLSLLSAVYGLGAKPILRKRESLALERVQKAAMSA